MRNMQYSSMNINISLINSDIKIYKSTKNQKRYLQNLYFNIQTILYIKKKTILKNDEIK